MRRSLLLTGATGLLGGEVLARLLRADRSLHVYALIRDSARWRAAATRHGIPAERVEPVRGELRQPGLGLDASTRARLSREVGAVLHLAADITFSRSLAEARATNLEGTRNLLELCADGPTARRFALVSSVFAAGRRTGRILESDVGGQLGWVNAYEQSKWEAEQLVRAWAREWVILRSSTVVCDSPAGEVSQFNAVHQALRLYHNGLAPMMPGSESAPVDFVTRGYVADAIARLALRADVAGETFHLCAGAGAMPLGELLDATYAVWARSPVWLRRGISRPALADLATYRLFEKSVAETGDARLQQVTRSLSHFVPQLALPKDFDTARADAALGAPAPPVRSYWVRMLEWLLTSHWTGSYRRAA